jgi:hypothetical protein
VVTPDPSGTNLVVADVDRTDYTFRARLDHVPEGVALAFRYRDASNYWGVMALPGFGDWRVFRIVDGNRTEVANFGGYTRCQPGSVLSISSRSDGVMIMSADGVLALELSSGVLADAHVVGLLATGPDAQSALFSSLEVLTRVPELSSVPDVVP